MDAGSDHSSAANRLATDFKVAGSGPGSCCLSFPSPFFTICSLLPCLSLILIA